MASVATSLAYSSHVSKLFYYLTFEPLQSKRERGTEETKAYSAW
jgi:hypothetical protein